jgi:hypothetical protein
MNCDLDNNTVSIAIVGPSAEVISGSLLRPANIYYSLCDLRKVVASYIPVRSVFGLLPQLRKILHADIIVLSGVNPWISAFIVRSERCNNTRILYESTSSDIRKNFI